MLHSHEVGSPYPGTNIHNPTYKKDPLALSSGAPVAIAGAFGNRSNVDSHPGNTQEPEVSRSHPATRSLKSLLETLRGEERPRWLLSGKTKSSVFLECLTLTTRSPPPWIRSAQTHPKFVFQNGDTAPLINSHNHTQFGCNEILCFKRNQPCPT